MSKVSIILPIYKVEKYLTKCLDSLINQTLSDIEIICIDDCSPDNSIRILREYALKDERIKIINLKENIGAAGARNKGLEVAKGEYLGFVDPDDYIDLNFYEELYKKALEDGADIVKAEIITIEPNGKKFKSDLNKQIISFGKFSFSYEWCSAIYKTKFIKENNIVFPLGQKNGEDSIFLFKCILNTEKISFINDTHYNYIRRENSLDYGKIDIGSIKSIIKAREIILDELNNSSLFEANKELYINVFYMCYISLFYPASKNDSMEAKTLCAQSFINLFYTCKDIQKLKEKLYKLPVLIKQIEKKDVQSLTQDLLKYQTREKYAAMNLIQMHKNKTQKS